MNKYKRQKMAEDTKVRIDCMNEMIKSEYFSSYDCEQIKKEPINVPAIETKVEVRFEDVVYTVLKEKSKVTVLNFGSAKNPGGGWLGTAQAQEEAIARVSSLYNHLKNVTDFYKNKKHHQGGFYDSDIIYSPNVSLIKTPEDKILNRIIPFNVITSCAVNVSALKEPINRERVRSEMKKRIENIFEIAIQQDTETLVLGAFGCGVFKNSPIEVAAIFKEVIYSERYKNKIPHIIFSIIGHDYMYDIFKSVEKEDVISK